MVKIACQMASPDHNRGGFAFERGRFPHARFGAVAALFMAVSSAVLPSAGAATNAIETDAGLADIVRVDVLHGWRTLVGSHMAAVRFRLAEEWKTYWRQPGVNGISPRFDMRQSRNLDVMEIHWPAPRAFGPVGNRVIGYEDELVLPLELFPADGNTEISFDMRLDFGVCRDVCIPVTTHLRYSTSSPLRSHRQLIESALGQLPDPLDRTGFSDLGCGIEKQEHGFLVTARIRAPDDPGREVEALFELPGAPAWIEPYAVEVDGSVITAKARVRPFGTDGFILDRSRLLLTLLTGLGAIEIPGCDGQG
ncbi:MAG: protein-disulfide reductase DsbD family protein [Paracoccaceae bacterium]|nr:protein-disulfide reductase DsbD family protein [Paracoccaceae bacterium]